MAIKKTALCLFDRIIYRFSYEKATQGKLRDQRSGHLFARLFSLCFLLTLNPCGRKVVDIYLINDNTMTTKNLLKKAFPAN